MDIPRSFKDEIVRVLTTPTENNCLKYKPFFEKHGYKVECTKKHVNGGDLYNLTAIKKNNSENKSKDEKIVSTILAKDPTIKIRSYNEDEWNVNFQNTQYNSETFESRFDFNDPDISVLNTFETREKCDEYIKQLNDLGWNNVKCHEERKNNIHRYYVYANKSDTRMEAKINNRGKEQDIEIDYSKSKESKESKKSNKPYGETIEDEDAYEVEDEYDIKDVEDAYDDDDEDFKKALYEDDCKEEYMTKSDKLYKMEDNNMKFKHYVKEGRSKEESSHLINITKKLYKNITKIWSISDNLGKNIKILGSKYKKLCLESKMQRTEYERVCLKLRAMKREQSYLEDVKKRYLEFRQMYEKEKNQSYTKDEKIRLLEMEISNLKKYRNVGNEEIDKIRIRYEKKLEDIKINISNYKKKIEELSLDSEETRKHIDESTIIVNSIIDDRNCDTIYGGAENCKKINERKMLYFSVYKYLDSNYISSMKTSIDQWGKLSNYIWGMNKIMNMTDLDVVLNYDIIIPDISDDHKKHYLLFLYQLDILKIVPNKECKILANILKLPKEIKNCNEMKKYFKKDIENLKKFLKNEF